MSVSVLTGDRVLRAAAEHIRTGSPESARRLLEQIIQINPTDEQAWLLLASAAQSVEEKRATLARALIVSPKAPAVRAALLALSDPSYVREAARAGIFICYARSDELFAMALAEDLRFFELPAWLDAVDIADDEDWHEAVASALARCGLMVLVLSPAARADNVQAEVDYFVKAGKIVLPVRAKPNAFTELPVWYPPIDFSEDYASGLQDLLNLVLDDDAAAPPARAR